MEKAFESWDIAGKWLKAAVFFVQFSDSAAAKWIWTNVGRQNIKEFEEKIEEF